MDKKKNMFVVFIVTLLLMNIVIYQYINPAFYSVANADKYPSYGPDAFQEVAMPDDPYKDFGSAKRLSGNCVFFIISIQDSESAVGEAEREKVFYEMTEAAAFLQRQAAGYGRALNIIFGEPDLLFEVEMETDVFLSGEDCYWATDVVNGIPKAEIEAAVEKYQADSFGFILSVDKEGTGYAIPTTGAYDQKYFYEPCILPVSAGAFVYAHEIMHLFGAKDLYDYANPNGQKVALAKSLFPNDLMLAYTDNLWQVSVCDVDAYLVGWSYYVLETHRLFLEAGNAI